VSDQIKDVSAAYMDLFKDLPEVADHEALPVDTVKLNAFFEKLAGISATLPKEGEEGFEEIRDSVQAFLTDHLSFGDGYSTQAEPRIMPPPETIEERLEGLADKRILPIYLLRDLLMRRVSVKNRDQLPFLTHMTATMASYIR